MKAKPVDDILREAILADKERVTREGHVNSKLDWDKITNKVNSALAAAGLSAMTKDQLVNRWQYIMRVGGQAAE